MTERIQIDWAGQKLQLLRDRALFLPESKVLVVSDLHIGKATHFRRAGIPVPKKANEKNVESLLDLLFKLKPTRVIFLGDLFHSHYNSEWEVFGQILNYFPACRFDLVSGNHDILGEHQYSKFGIQVFPELKFSDELIFRHEFAADETKIFQISGHLHPAISLKGKVLNESFPCYWIRDRKMVLPAFGAFTGLYRIAPKKNDQVFFIADNQIIDGSLLSAEQ